MSDFLRSGNVGHIETEYHKNIRKQIVERWDGLNFLGGLDGHKKETIATLFESQAKTLIQEASNSSASGSFETVVFPIIRRVFAKLLANDIVSVQAMTMPIGKLFFFKPTTSERQWEEVDGEMVGRHAGLMGYERQNRNKDGKVENRFYLPDDVVDAGAKVTKYMKKSLYDLFYNDGLFDNSKGKITIKVGDIEPVIMNQAGEYEKVADITKYPTHQDGSIHNMMVEVSGFSSFNAGRLTGPDGNEMDTEAFTSSLKATVATAIAAGADGYSAFEVGEEIKFRFVTQRYGKGLVDYSNICAANGKVYLELDFTKPVLKAGQTLSGYIGIDPVAVTNVDILKVAWAQYDSLELETEMGEVSFGLDSVVVAAEARKLRATWSPELAQDVSAFHNIDAEAELTAILSEQIAAEIDREILRDLRKEGAFMDKWNYNGWRTLGGFSTNYTQKDWNQELVTTINRLSANIHKATLRGGANFIVVSSEVSAVFDTMEYFHVTDAGAEKDQYNMGIERVGSLQNRFQVYRDPYAPANSIIVGHMGTSLLDTGYVYAPYVPMQLTQTITNPFNFAPIKGILTRYAKKMVNNRFYGRVVVDGLSTFNVSEWR